MNPPSTSDTSEGPVTTVEVGSSAVPSADGPPASVGKAFAALMTALALTVVNALLAVISPPTTEDYAAFIRGMRFPTDPGATRTAAEAGNTAALVNLSVIVVFVAIFVHVGLQMRRGASWARVVIAVLAVLGILGGVAVVLTYLLVAPLPLAGGVLGVVLLVLLAATLATYLAFAFRRSANRYFAASPQ